MADEPEPEYTCLLEFTSDDPNFALGFEAGGMWERLKQFPPRLEETVHAANDEQFHLMARRLGYEVEFQYVENGWAFATFTEARPAARH